MSTTNRRHDDYRPASLRNFWQSVQNGVWTLEQRARDLFDIVHFVVVCAIGIAALALSVYVLRFLFDIRFLFLG